MTQTSPERKEPPPPVRVATGLGDQDPCPTCGKPQRFGLMVYEGQLECSICFIARRVKK